MNIWKGRPIKKYLPSNLSVCWPRCEFYYVFRKQRSKHVLENLWWPQCSLKTAGLLNHSFLQAVGMVKMTFWRNRPQCIFNILKCHISCLELWDVGGVCNCLSFNKLSLFFFSKENLKLNLLLPFPCLLSSLCLCHAQYMLSALPLSSYLPDFEIISETMEGKKNLSCVSELNNEAVYSIGILRMFLFSPLYNIYNLC